MEGNYICERCKAENPSQVKPYIANYFTNSTGKKWCYECSNAILIEQLLEDGRGVCWLTCPQTRPGHGLFLSDCKLIHALPLPFRILSAWTGHHNMAGVRYDVNFTIPGDKYVWHGTTYGNNTEICHLRRTKRLA